MYAKNVNPQTSDYNYLAAPRAGDWLVPAREHVPFASLTPTMPPPTPTPPPPPPPAHRLDPVLRELDAKVAACTEEEDRRQVSGAMAERETRVIGVYRQVGRKT